MQIEGSVTPMEGVVGLYGKFTLACLPLSSGPAPEDAKCARSSWSPAPSVGDRDICTAESGRCLSPGPWYGPSPQASLGRGHASRLLPTSWSIGAVGLGSLEKITGQEGGCLIHVWSEAIQSAIKK